MDSKIKSGPEQKGRFFIEKNVFFLSLVSLFTDTSSEVIYPLLPIFLTSVLGASTGFVGLVEGVAESTASILKLFSGWISDRLKRRKPLVLFGYSLSSLTRPIMAVATAPWHVLIIRFSDRIGKGIRNSPRDALIADSTPPQEQGRAFSFNRAMDHLGAIFGSLTAFILLSTVTLNFRYIFLIASIPGIIAVLVVIFLVRERKPAGLSGETIKLSLRPFNKRFKLFLLIIIVFTLGNSSDAFLILRAKNLGIHLALIPVLWMVLHIVKSASSLPGGIFSDKFGRKKAIVAGWIIYGIVYLGFAFSYKTVHMWILFAVYGIFYGLTEGVEKALVADIVPSELRGTAYGVYNFAIGIASFPASLIMGYLWQLFGVAVAFCFGAALALLAAVLFVLYL